MLDEFVILIRVNVGAGGDRGDVGIRRLRFDCRDALARPPDHLLRELIVDRRYARLGDDQQSLVILAEKVVAAAPVEIKAGEIREALSALRGDLHQA